MVGFTSIFKPPDNYRSCILKSLLKKLEGKQASKVWGSQNARGRNHIDMNLKLSSVFPRNAPLVISFGDRTRIYKVQQGVIAK